MLLNMLINAVFGNSIAYKALRGLAGGNRASKILVGDYIKCDKNTRILDLCCGTSDILPYLHFKDYTGVDSSNKHIKHNKKRFKKINNASFIAADVKKYLKENKACFDTVLILGGMHHIDDEALTELLNEIKEALPPEGKLVTIDGCYEPKIHWFAKLQLDYDRGHHVRTKEAWLELFFSVFPDYKYAIRKNLIYIPYNHIIFYK